jgi:hypothetical protein
MARPLLVSGATTFREDQAMTHHRHAATCWIVGLATALLMAAGAAPASPATPAASDRLDSGTLAGRWTAPCFKSSLLPSRYTSESLEFTADNHFAREMRDYTRRGCPQSSLYEARAFEGTYAIGGPVLNVPGARAMDFTIGGMFLTPLGPAAEKAANETKLCAAADWKLGERRDVTGFVCNGKDMAAGTVVYDIARLEGGQLTFGKMSYFHTGASPKERPKLLDASAPVFTRVGALGH